MQNFNLYLITLLTWLALGCRNIIAADAKKFDITPIKFDIADPELIKALNHIDSILAKDIQEASRLFSDMADCKAIHTIHTASFMVTPYFMDYLTLDFKSRETIFKALRHKEEAQAEYELHLSDMDHFDSLKPLGSYYEFNCTDREASSMEKQRAIRGKVYARLSAMREPFFEKYTTCVACAKNTWRSSRDYKIARCRATLAAGINKYNHDLMQAPDKR